MQFEAHVDVGHRDGILDPQGMTVERSLPALGYTNVSHVRVGKSLRLRIEADNAESARRQVAEMCERLLANPVIERYTIEVSEVTADVVAR